jgi:hypothetical protein
MERVDLPKYGLWFFTRMKKQFNREMRIISTSDAGKF